jgi:phospholipase D1/2
MKISRLLFVIIWASIYLNLLFNYRLRTHIIELFLFDHFLSPLLVISGQVIFSFFVLPCSIFTLLSGMIWGFKVGLLYSIAGTIISACLTFIAGRYLNNRLLYKKSFGNLEKIFTVIDKYNWKASFLVYINPLFPSSSLGFVFGASSIKFRYFILGAFLGTLPLQLLMVYFASAGDSFFSLWTYLNTLD